MMKRNCDESGEPLLPQGDEESGVLTCAKDGCTGVLRVGDRFCRLCGVRAPERLLRASTGVGAAHDDENPPVDPSWDYTWKVNKLTGRNVTLFYREEVKGVHGEPDGLVALALATLVAPDATYNGLPFTKAQGFTVPPWLVYAEVMSMRISMELPLNHKVLGVTPHPTLARRFDGKKEALYKLAAKDISIPSLIESWQKKQRVIMIFNISQLRAGLKSRLSYLLPPEWTEDASGRLPTAIDKYFPAGATVFGEWDERPRSDNEEEEEEEEITHVHKKRKKTQ